MSFNRDKKKVSFKKVKKDKENNEILYIYIIFRNCTTTDIVLEHFV